ncbi:MAG: type VI secretion system membrane subunit TssM, partial [Pseudomonadota bacterium]
MYTIFRAIFSTIGIIVIVSLILSAVLWFLGPLIGWDGFRFFDSPWNRGYTIGGLWVATIFLIMLILILRKGRDEKIQKEIVEAQVEEDPADSAVAAELAEMQTRMKEALTTLRKSKIGGSGGRHLYQLPWYIIIGPPGSGKTTAIVNSGLQFPLAEKFGKKALGGVGGTRNCDWWFTNDAVLLDTAGRYTTQDSDAEQDSRGWTGFLSMLKKQRPRQPINGALIAISLSDLSQQDERSRQNHAAAIRTRLNELRETLGVRFPIYVLFTKADLIAGFAEFFEDLGKEDREQVWGFTLQDPRKGAPEPVAAFQDEFEALLQRLNDRSLERMQAELEPQRRSLIAAFPAQVASLRQVASDFLGEIFQESRFADSQLLRGVYFTSGTQEGTPIDRLMMGMARTFGIGRQAIGSGTGTGRSYFLTRLLNGVIFKEAGLVSADDVVERRYKWTLRGAIAAGVLATAGGIGAWTLSFIGNTDMIASARAEVTEFRDIVGSLPPGPIADDDFAAVSPALDILREMPGNPALGDPDPETELTFGLYQGEAIGTEAAQTYREALNRLLLPRILWRLEQQMQSNMNDADFLYEALKVYLMMGLEGPMDSGLVRQWMEIDWALTFPGQEGLVEQLNAHLDTMLSQPMRKIDLNGPLVEQIQGILSETPLAQRVYNGIVQSAEARDLPAFRLTEAGGAATSRVMIRPSSQPLSDGIDGLWTKAGFEQVMLPEAAEVAARVQAESWVLGERGEQEATPGNLARLQRDVMNLYYNDYITKYDALLGDVDVIPMDSLSHAVEVTGVLSGPSSPIKNILDAVTEEVWLTKPVEEESLADNPAAQKGAKKALGKAGKVGKIAKLALRAQGGSDAPPPPGEEVAQRFQWLIDLTVAEEGAPSQLDTVISTYEALYRELNRMSLGQAGGQAVLGQPGQEGGASGRLLEAAASLPGPLARWTKQTASGASGIAAGGARATLNAKWQAQIYPFCQRALNGRYPFDRSARADTTLQDFAKLFAPSGLIDTFFNENLITLVDTTAKPWRWRQVNDTDLGISQSVLTQLERAAEIRDAFFLAPGQPTVTFDLTPVALAPEANQVILEVDGAELTYAHGPPQTQPFQWPGGAVGQARVAFAPQSSGIENSMRHEGPWAWFRLLDAAELRKTNVSDRNRVIFNVGGRIAVFQLRAGSA